MQTAQKTTNKDIRKTVESYECSRDSLIPILQGVQDKLGYLSEDSIGEISRYLEISQTEIYGVATFYTQFKFTEPGEHMIKMCLGTACHVRGGSQIMDELSRHLGIEAGGTTEDMKFSLERVACFGSCALAPVIVVDNKVYGRMTPKKVKRLLKEIE